MYRIKYICILQFWAILIMGMSSVHGQPVDSLLHRMLYGRDSLVDQIFRQEKALNLQIILTTFPKDTADGGMSHHYLNRDRFYFYPASLIKLPLAIVVMEEMTRLAASHGVSIDDSVSLGDCTCGSADTRAYLQKVFPVTVRQLLREMLVMSNNRAYHFFFDLVGMEAVNARMQSLGFERILMKRRFLGDCDSTSQRRFGTVAFHAANGSVKHMIPCSMAADLRHMGSDWPAEAGLRHKENGRWVAGPKIYRQGNYVSLTDAHHLLIRLMMPGRFGADTFAMHPAFRAELVQSLGLFPRELVSLTYPQGQYPDHYYKYLLQPTLMDTRSGGLRIYNKVGIASGFISDVSFFRDEEKDLSFVLSVSMHANRKGDVESGAYDYFTIGIPFMRRVGGMVYEWLTQSSTAPLSGYLWQDP